MKELRNGKSQKKSNLVERIYQRYFCNKMTERKLRKSRAMSLIEIMVVLFIIGLLGTFVFMNLMPTVDKAKVTAATVQMSTLKQALFEYKMDNGDYPMSNQGLNALISMPSTEPLPRNYKSGGYLAEGRMPQDPWGNDYVYEYPAPDQPGRYLLKSLGSDSREGGEGIAADISSDRK